MKCRFCESRATHVVLHVTDFDQRSPALCCDACSAERSDRRFVWAGIRSKHARKHIARAVANKLVDEL